MEVINLFTLDDEIQFWGKQIKKHMKFIHLGLADIPENINLKQEALTLKDSWHEIIYNDTNTQHNKKLSVLDLINVTDKYQIKIRDYIKNNVWLGWLSYSFVDHLIKELIYFKDKVSGKGYNIIDEIIFWSWHHESEISASEKLLDPSEEELSRLSKQYIEDVKILQEDIEEVMRSEDFQLEDLNTEAIRPVLDEYLGQTEDLRHGIISKTVLTNISLDLVNHVIREGKRAIQIFDLLQHKNI